MKTPGDFLGTEEEYSPGRGTYEERGEIRSALIGDLKVDKDRRMQIKTDRVVPSRIKPGMVVYGRVEEIFDPVALVRLEPMATGEERQVSEYYYTVLHVSKIKMGYARSIKDEVRIGDIIKAVVEEIRNGEVYLSTRRGGMGVVKAFCTRCRSPLRKEDMFLVCDRCQNKEKRKLGSPYRG